MSVPNIRFLDVAEMEIDEAADWYAAKDEGERLADDFSRNWIESFAWSMNGPRPGRRSSRESVEWSCDVFHTR